MPLRGFLDKPSRARKSRSAMLAKQLLWRSVKREVMKRDGYKCRCCGSRDVVDGHHIKFRSAGGGDSTRNVCALCRVCHDDLHGYRLAIVGDNANGKLRFVRRT
jgi:5-methylcytosine-specific restriction endonuclease McrA